LQKGKAALVTLDTDFCDIRKYSPQDYHGLIVLRLKRQDKPHVLSYSLIVYKMAYLKTYYFEEFSEVLDKDEFFKRLKVYPLQEVKQIVVNE
jgi:hypothetical protein